MTQYGRDIDQHPGKNRKRQANLFNRDGSRVEIMEAATADRTPTPSVTTPLPQ